MPFSSIFRRTRTSLSARSSTPPPSYQSLPLDSKTASGTKAESSAAPPGIFVYYRVFMPDGAIPCAKPVNDRNPYLGCINALHVTPPHTAASLIRCICKAEGKGHRHARLFELESSPSSMDGYKLIAALSGSGPGADPQKPVAILLDRVIHARRDGGSPGSGWLSYKRGEDLTTSGEVHKVKSPAAGFTGKIDAYFAENTRGETGYVLIAHFKKS